MLQRSIFQRIKLSSVTVAISLVLFSMIGVYGVIGAVQIEIETTQPGQIRLLWSNGSSPYEKDKYKEILVDKGRSSHKIMILGAAPTGQIRMATDFFHSYIKIHRVDVHRPLSFVQSFWEGNNYRGLKIIKGIDEVDSDQVLKYRAAGRDATLELTTQYHGNAVALKYCIALIAAAIMAVCALYMADICRQLFPSIYNVVIYALWIGVLLQLTQDAVEHNFIHVTVVRATLTYTILCILFLDFVIRIGESFDYGLLKIPLEKLPIILSFLMLVIYIGFSNLEVYREIVRGFVSEYVAVGRKTELKDFPSYFERTFRDHYKHRDDLVYLNAWIKIYGFGYSPTQKVLLGKEGYYFEGYGDRRVEGDYVKSFDNVSDYMGLLPFTDKELEEWASALEDRKNWLEQKGIPYLFVLAPTKALIYPEKLPDKLQRIKRKLAKPNRYEQLASYLQEKRIVPFVNLRKVLLEARQMEKNLPLFYRSDFHWNFLGAFYAYKAIVEKINEAYPQLNINPMNRSEFNVDIDKNWVHARFMNMVGLIKLENHMDEWYIRMQPNANLPIKTVKQMPSSGAQDIYIPKKTVSLGEKEFSFQEITNAQGKLDNILLIGDSFIEKTLLYFGAHAKSTKYIRAIDDFPTKPYEFVRPDIVIQEILNMYILQSPPKNNL